MESLTKENFWNDLRAKYPAAVDDFCKWIDQYKMEVCWDHLFLNELRFMEPAQYHGKEIKFHDLPFDMQAGILIRYIEEKEKGATVDREEYIDLLKHCLRQFFKEQHEQISN
jgi:hypothetical protein